MASCNGRPCASHKLLSLTALPPCLLALLLYTISSYTSGLSPSPSHSKSPFPSAGLSSDCDALQEVAASLSHASSSAHRFFGLHWKPERDCCVWRGVTCGISSPPFSHSSRVVGLNLTGIRRGWDAAATSLPRGVCELSALTSLDLSDNWLEGAIPNCFSYNLTSLQTLVLGQNDLYPISPLANLSLIAHLDLSFNPLESFNSSFSTLNFPYLTYLDISKTGASLSAASLPLRLHNPRLQYLNLDQGPCSDLSFISGLSDMQHLSVDFDTLSVYIGASSAAYLSTTPLLRYLVIYSNKLQIDTGGFRALQCLLHLEVLKMRVVSVSASSLGSVVCGLRSLKLLYLLRDQVQVQRISGSSDAANYSFHIDKLPCEKPASVDLRNLSLYGQGFTGPIPAWVGHFTRLQFLNLRGNNFQGSIPREWLQTLTHLNSLHLSGESPSARVPISQKTQNWLFRLPLQGLSLRSMGLQFHNMQCEAGFSLLNQTLMWLDLSDNHFSASLWHCLQHHNFSRLQKLNLSHNPLALQLQPPVPNFVEKLDLSFCQLSGSLSMDLFPKPASSGSYIYFAHNNLSGSIPSQIGTLGSDLFLLDLSHNKLMGPIPPIWNLSAISTLLLKNNYLSGELLLSPQSLVNCEVLSVANNYLSKASFHNVSETFMKCLDLSFNQLQGSFEDLLGDYSLLGEGLVVLLLFHNQLSGSIPTSLGTLAPALVTMDLSHNRLTGVIPPSLQHLQALQSKIPVTSTAKAILNDYIYTLDSVKNLKSSEQFYLRGHLDLSFNQLSGSIPDGLGALLGLNDLILSNNQLSGPIPADLALLVSLESLDLSYNNLQGAIPEALSSLTSLEIFNVSFNPELRGPIPDGSQLDTDIDSYKGDYGLCGQLLHRHCGKQLMPAVTEESPVAKTHEKESIKERISRGLGRFDEWVAIPGICVGYVVGVGLTIWGLKLLHFYKYMHELILYLSLHLNA